MAAALHQLHEIMSAHESEMAMGAAARAAAGGGGQSDDDAASDEFAPVLDAVLEPLIEMCR